MKAILASLILSAVPLFGQNSIAEADTPNIPVTTTIGFTSNYMARGTTQTMGEPAAFVMVEGNVMDKVYIGSYFSNVDFVDGTSYEYDFWVSYRTQIGKWSTDVSALVYAYIDAPVSYDMFEFKVSGSRPLTEKLTFNTNVAFTPDYFNISGPSLWTELGLSYQLCSKVTLSGSMANQWIIQDWGTYKTANLGVMYQINETLSLDVRYYKTDRPELGKWYYDALSFTVRITL